jgi:Zn finger protein HypA/HybF involved in hydrogenase expression
MVTRLYRTLEQELQALARGVSLECLVCGEFVLRTARQISCPECGSHVRAAAPGAFELSAEVDAR